VGAFFAFAGVEMIMEIDVYEIWEDGFASKWSME